MMSTADGGDVILTCGFVKQVVDGDLSNESFTGAIVQVLETSWSLSNNGHNHCSVTMSDGEHLMECFLAPSLHSLVRSEALKKYKLVEYPPVPPDHHHSSHASQEMKDQHHTTLHQSLQDGTELVCITRGTPIMCSMTLLFIYHFITSCTEPVERLLTTNAMILH
jgi:hypothetical protein